MSNNNNNNKFKLKKEHFKETSLNKNIYNKNVNGKRFIKSVVGKDPTWVSKERLKEMVTHDSQSINNSTAPRIYQYDKDKIFKYPNHPEIHRYTNHYAEWYPNFYTLSGGSLSKDKASHGDRYRSYE